MLVFSCLSFSNCFNQFKKLCKFSVSPNLDIATMFLFLFDRFKQCFDVAGTESTETVPFDQFEKNGRPILDWFGKDLKQMSIVVVIDQNVMLVQFTDLAVDGHIVSFQSLLEILVISGRSVQKFHS